VGKHSKDHVELVAAGDAAVAPRQVGMRSVVLAGATLSVAASVLATAATSPESFATLSMELAALITPANSTAQVFAGSDYYNRNWAPYGDPQVVPFFLGPQGIADAIEASDEPTVVLASGWGAGQTGTALGLLDPEDRDNIDLVVLDNNTNRAGGGFWTTYAPFAPLLLTSAEPTPSDTGVPVLDVAYEYNINSDAPTYPINLLADANSLAAYVYGYGAQSTAPVPQEAIDDAQGKGDDVDHAQHYHYIVDSDGKVVGKTPVAGTTTYVTFKSENLPLLRPLRVLPGGAVVADALEPTATALVNLGYQDGNSIPENPGKTQPMGLLPPTSQITQTVQALPGTVNQGAKAAQDDLSDPVAALTPSTDGLPTGLLGSIPGGAGSLPGTSTTSKPRLNVLTSDGNKAPVGGTAGSTATTGGRANPLGTAVKTATNFNNELAKAVKKALQPAGSQDDTSGE
jgi:hypothetical protein